MSDSQAHVPIRAITKGPGYHWFGYYDKLQFDPTSRYVLAMSVGFEHRAPRPGDEIGIGVIDLQDGDAWRPLGTTTAWCWQQGCMLQWIPGSASAVIWNERAGDRYVARITDTATGASRTVPAAVYALAPDGRTAVGPDFRRLNDMRPGYGYEGIADPYADQLAPEESGIHTVDLDTGETRQIISVAEAAAVPYPHGDLSRAKHYFNHLLFNPDGTRFIFLHRWRTPGERGMRTRMFTSNADGSDLHVVDDYGGMSHFIWRSKKRAYLCFDEWNVWYKNREMDGEGKAVPHLIEEVYNLEDALVVAGFLHSFVRHADVLKIANLAQIVNVIAPLVTRGDELLVQSIFYPLAMFASRRDGEALRLAVEGPRYEGAGNGEVDYVDASAILDGERLHLFLTNRSLTEPAPVALAIADRAVTACEAAEILTGPEPKAANSFAEPELIKTREFTAVATEDGEVRCELPPLSFAALTVRLAPAAATSGGRS